jgi:DNA-binding NarL/FixJ family response regulator
LSLEERVRRKLILATILPKLSNFDQGAIGQAIEAAGAGQFGRLDKEALKLQDLRKQKFDLMFLNLQLPDAPGDQVYKTAKQIDPDLNVIVITDYPDSEILDRILQVSPVTVLKKPLKVEQLNRTVNILGHKTPKLDS